MQRGKINQKHRLDFSLSPLFFLAPIKAEQIDLTTIPQFLADQLGIPLFAGQILASIILMLIILLPVTILTRSKKAGFLPELAFSLGVLSLCIALGWLPLFVLVVVILCVAGLWGAKVKGWFT